MWPLCFSTMGRNLVVNPQCSKMHEKERKGCKCKLYFVSPSMSDAMLVCARHIESVGSSSYSTAHTPILGFFAGFFSWGKTKWQLYDRDYYYYRGRGLGFCEYTLVVTNIENFLPAQSLCATPNKQAAFAIHRQHKLSVHTSTFVGRIDAIFTTVGGASIADDME